MTSERLVSRAQLIEGATGFFDHGCLLSGIVIRSGECTLKSCQPVTTGSSSLWGQFSANLATPLSHPEA